jgi:CheY-like chemotaxis protein
LRGGDYDIFITDLDLPDGCGKEFIKEINESEGIVVPKIFVYSSREITKEEFLELEEVSQSIILKGNASKSRLMDDIGLFFESICEKAEHQTTQGVAKNNIEMGSAILKDKRILLVDDDVRNTFALTKYLKKEGLKITMADNGQAALKKLFEAEEAFHLVLMDIMMPVMDGYEAMGAIRKERKYKELPIIALTANAMPEDRKKCIDAGASDYLTKPVDMEKLLSLMRVWIAKN